MALESTLERRLYLRAKAHGGQAVKIYKRNWPDRMILLPGGQIGFCEVKRRGEEPRPGQERKLAKLRFLGFVAEYVDTPEKIETLIERIRKWTPKKPTPKTP